MDDFADEKYTRLCRLVVAESASIQLEGVINHFERKLDKVEDWLSSNTSLIGDVDLNRHSTEYAYTQLGCMLMLREMLDKLKNTKEVKESD